MSDGHNNIIKGLDGQQSLLVHVLDGDAEIVRVLVIGDISHHRLESDVVSQISLVPAPLKTK